MPLEDQLTALYRFYDSSGTLLYVGITNDPEARWRYHALTKAWWPAVAKKIVDWRPDRPDAERAEAAAIFAERPIHNCVHAFTEPADMPLRDARSRFTHLVDHVRDTREPRWITRHGRRSAVIVSRDFYERALAALGETAVPAKSTEK
ncbi:type II toxin-antitoxin system prevent-host-death family antitoxin [Streptomyces sp. T1317-0309]|nr:type II toxin-antitoxin system prevent-host-death family antitoxin [Streptomyces sp. T1317-0309]